MSIMDGLFAGAGDVLYQRRAEELRATLELIDKVAKLRTLAEMAVRKGCIEDADAEVSVWIDKAVQQHIDTAKMETHAKMIELGVEDPSSLEDFAAGLFGVRRKKGAEEDPAE